MGLNLANRRLWTGITWAAMNYLTLYLQPLLGLDVEACKLMFIHSTYVAGFIVLGLSMTDYATTRYANGNGGTK